jgi:RecA-family ATPase
LPRIQYFYPPFLKSQQVNMVIGPSGSNKTTYVLHLLEAMTTGAPFLEGLPEQAHMPITHYVCLDRPYEELEAKLDIFQIDRSRLHLVSYADQLRKVFATSFDIFLSANVPPDTEYLVLDGVGFLVDKVISQRHVGVFMSDMLSLCRRRGIHVTAIHHTAKAKQGSSYANPREKALGSGAWVQMAGTAMVCDYLNAIDPTDPRRTFAFLDNMAAGRVFPLRIESGRIIHDVEITEFDRTEIEAALPGVDPSTITRRIQEWTAARVFERLKNGHFRGRFPL